MRARRSLAALSLVLALPAGAHAQVRDSEVEVLRAKIEAQQALIEAQQAAIVRLEARLTAVESEDAAPLPRVQPVPPTRSADARAQDAAERVVDLADIPNGGLPSDLGAGGGSTASWSLAPPGPIDQPLRPMHDGHAAAFELLAGSGSGRASFTFSRSKDRGGALGRQATAVFNDTLTLSLSAPLAKEGDTSFATLDGLASGSKLEFGYTQFRGRILTQSEDSRHPLLIEARRRCREETPAYKPGCVRLDDAFMSRFFSPEERNAYERDYARQTIQQSFAWSLRAALGYDEFAYFPLPTLGKEIDHKVSWSVGGGLSFFPFDSASASLDLDFQRSFKARKAQTTCPSPTGGATSVNCVPGPLLGPERTDKLILGPELRYLVSLSEDGLIRDLGFAPRVEFDLLADSVAFDLPIYLAADDKDGLIGGLRFGYLTEDDEVKFGIFVGKSFSLFK